MKLIRIITLIAILLSIANFGYGQSLNGTVNDNDGNPLIGANITVYNLQGSFLVGSQTDVDGNYEITNLEKGVYLLKISYTGFSDQSVEVSISKEGKNTQNFNLESEAFFFDEVVISAGRKAEKVSESTANIQVINTRKIEVSQEPSLIGELKGLVGVDYYESGLGQQTANARGFASVFTGGMLTLVDNRSVVLPGLGATFSPVISASKEDVKQIEVIVGPNSALYGANASQGVINIITKNPREHSGHSITVGAGNLNQLRLSARSSAMLGSKFGYKISGNYFSATDFDQSTPVFGKDTTGASIQIGVSEPDLDIKTSVLTGSLYYYPSRNTEISLTSGYSNANYINHSNIGILQIKDMSYQFNQLRANFSNFLNFGSAFIQVYNTSNDLGKTYDLEKAKLLELAFGMNKDDAAEATRFIDKAKQVAAEWQHNFTLKKDHSFTWGVQWSKISPDSEGTIIADGPDDSSIELNNTGAYLQYENTMIKNFKLTLTGRYDNSDIFGDNFSPKVALSYGKNGHNFRIVYNNAFSTPPVQPAFSKIFLGNRGIDLWLRGAHAGFDLINVGTGETRKIDALVPTIATSYEIGYKGLLGSKGVVNLTAYTTEITNFMSGATVINDPANGWFVVGSDGNPLIEVTLSYLNFGKAKVSGLDASFDYLINKKLRCNLGYSYAKYGAFEDVPEGIAPPPSNSPENVIKGGLTFSDWIKPDAYANLSFRFIEEYEWNQAREYQRGIIPSYSVVNLNIEIPFEIGEKSKLAIGLALNNILNNKHVEIIGGPAIGFSGIGYAKITF